MPGKFETIDMVQLFPSYLGRGDGDAYILCSVVRAHVVSCGTGLGLGLDPGLGEERRGV